MGFENQKFNTSTAERVTGTIQDKIDEKKLKISQVTKENLRNLKVEILYKKSSSLRVRDSEGKVIGRLKNDQNVDFNGEIKKAHGKLFLGVNMAKNRKGFVSADYVKGEISSEETPPVALTQKKEGKTSDVKTSVKHIDELSSSEEVTEVDIEDKSSREEIEAVENIKSISEELDDLKETAKDSEKLMTDSEYREERNIMILSALKDLNLAIEKESSKENPNKKEINQAKLYLAKYFSDMTEDGVDNKHWRNYGISNNIALSILPDENKPEPITEETINNEIVKNKGLMHFIKSSANSRGSAEEKLLNIYKTSAWQEMIEGLQDKYEDELEEYLEGVDSENLDEEQKSALDLLKDVNGVGFLDFKEENFDIFQDVGANLGIIAAGMWSGALAGGALGTAVPVGGNIVGFIGGAIVGGTISTLGIAGYNQDRDLLNWKEFGINIATMGAIGGAAKIGKSVSNISILGKHGGKVGLGTEMTADVLGVGVGIDILRSELYEEYEFDFSDSFISNLQWALLPLAMRGANNAKSKIPKEWTEKSNEVIAKLKLAKLTKISGGDNKKILEELDESLVKSRTEIEAKISKGDDTIKEKVTVEAKEITKPRKTIKNNEIPNISAKGKVDIDNPNLGDRVRVGDDIYEYRKYESTPGSNGSYAWFKEVDGKVVVDVTTPQFNYTHQLKDKLGGVRIVEHVNKSIDIDNPNLGDRVRVSDDIYEYRKYESSPGSDGSYAWFKEVDGKVVVDVTTPQFNYTHQLKDKLGGNTKINESRYDERDNYELNRDNVNKDLNIANPTKKEMELIEEQVDKLPKNPEGKEAYSSTPVKFYKGEDGKVYIKTLDNKFYNNGVEVDTSKIKLSEIGDKDNFGKPIKEGQKREETETKEQSKEESKSKKEGPEKKESLEIDTTLSRYERRRFKGLIKNELKTEGNVIIQNGDTQIKIKKEQNNKYSINDGETLYTLDEVIGKIDNDNVISYLNSKTRGAILTASKDKEIVLDKSMNLPFTGKVIIKDGEIIVKRGGKDGKDIIIRDEKKVKEFLNDPKMRAEILKSFVKNMTIDDIKKRLPKDKATLEFFKALPKETINFGLENLLGILKTATYGGATGVMLELFNNQYEGETMSENFSNLCLAFITGAALGGTVSLAWKGAKTIGITFKKTGELLKATKDMLINKYTVGTTIAIGGTLFVFDYLDDDHSKTTN